MEHPQLNLDNAVYETPIERYAREGKLMTGCPFGSKKLKDKTGKEVKDAVGNPIWVGNCGLMPAVGSRWCPKHKMITELKEAGKP